MRHAIASFAKIGSTEAGIWSENDPWWHVYNRCESPIERQMCVALSLALQPIPVIAPYRFEEVRAIAEKGASDRIILLYPQQTIDRFRVDFLIIGYSLKSDRCLRTVVECDGHDFHHVTIEQRRRDLERDRVLRSHGCCVFRFTGTQINRAADKIAALLVPWV